MEGLLNTMTTQACKTLAGVRHRSCLCNVFYSISAIIFAVSCTPLLICMYIGISLSRLFWLRVLELMYPELELVRSTTIRSTVDTFRNVGIITVVLQVKGVCQIDQFIAKIQTDLVECKKGGRLAFPHLKLRLTSLWGWYAWRRGSEVQFNINNHVTIANPVYSSGFQDEVACQKFISEMTSKYIHPDHPPWQVLVIPSSEKFYMLIRLHHLYLSEDRLGLGELLLLRPESSIWSESTEDYFDHESILAGTFKTPVAIPQAFQHICESVTKSWNELVSIYDPLENPKIVCNCPTLKSYSILILIVIVSVMKIYSQNETGNLRSIIRKESKRRGLTGQLFWHSLEMTFHPIVMVEACLQWAWWILVRCCLQFLHLLLNIPVYLYWTVLIYHVLRELWYLSKLAFIAPKVLLEELIFSRHYGESHHLQTVSLCGRKSISWSDPVSLDYVHSIHMATGASPCEILLAAVSASIRDYFHHAGFMVPQFVKTTARFIPQERLLAQSTDPVSRDTGLICLNLPLWTPDPSLGNLKMVQSALSSARDKQAPLHLAALLGFDYSVVLKIFPSIVSRILLNLLSRRYAVTLTQVEATTTERKRCRLLWGQEVEDLMYWWPPQANISLSLTLMSYGDTVRLGVMADTQISPQHTLISYKFHKHISQMGTAIGIL